MDKKAFEKSKAKMKTEEFSSDSFGSDTSGSDLDFGDVTEKKSPGFVPKKQSNLLSRLDSSISDRSTNSVASIFSKSALAEKNTERRVQELRKKSVDDGSASDDSTSDPKDKRVKWLIYPDDSLKRAWDMFLGFALIITCLTIPFHLALYFDEPDPSAIIVFNLILDIVFFVDIVITFNTAIKEDHKDIITSKVAIAKRYLRGWFWIDIIVTLPFYTLANWYVPDGSAAQVAQAVKFVRIMKILRIIRLLKLLKLIKDGKKMIKMRSYLKVHSAVERLIIMIFCFFLLCHVVACIWILQAKVFVGRENWIYVNGIIDYEKFELYVISYYFTVTTITTVGYGDLSACGTLERIFAIFLMMGGVFAFSFATGTLSAILSSFDEKNQAITEKLTILNKLVKRYEIDTEIN